MSDETERDPFAFAREPEGGAVILGDGHIAVVVLPGRLFIFNASDPAFSALLERLIAEGVMAADDVARQFWRKHSAPAGWRTNDGE